MEITKTKRIRVKVETTSKGLKSYSCTCDMEGYEMAEVLKESDMLVAALDHRYPPVEVKQ